MNASDVLMVDALSGAIGGIAAVIAGQPLDMAKVKMQLFPNMYRNMFKCLSTTMRHQGLRGVYAGTCPAIVSSCADNTIMFAAYGQSQRAVASFAGVNDTTCLSYLQNAAAGSITSLLTSSVICPMELVKIRMQAEMTCKDAVHKRSVGEVVRGIFKTGGLAGFFRGLPATVTRESVGNAVFFGVYERMREWLKPANGRKEDCTVAATVLAGVAAGASSWLVIYPVDVIKSRTQMSDKWVGGLQLIRNEAGSAAGLLAKLYSGLWPTLVKAVPMAGALLYAVESSKLFLRRKLVEQKEEKASKHTVDVLSYRDFFSGWIAGIVSTFVGHPMNTIGTIQQVTDTSFEKATRDVYVKDKFKGYFRGMLFPIMSAGVLNSVCFGVYGNTKRLIHAFRNDETEGGGEDGNKDVRFCCDAKKLPPYWHLDVFVSGCVAGACYTAITIPVEVVKTTLQLTNFPSTPVLEQKDIPKIVSPIKLMAQLYKSNGLRSLYRGGTLFVIRDVPSMGVYMLSYEHLCCELKRFWNSDESVPDDFTNKTEDKLVQILSGGLAGVLSWVFVLPFDMIKSKIIADDPTQPKYNGAWDCVLKTYRQGGASRFFRGFWVLCLRAFIVNGITFVTYEALLKACNWNNREDTPNEPDMNFVHEPRTF